MRSGEVHNDEECGCCQAESSRRLLLAAQDENVKTNERWCRAKSQFWERKALFDVMQRRICENTKHVLGVDSDKHFSRNGFAEDRDQSSRRYMWQHHVCGFSLPEGKMQRHI